MRRIYLWISSMDCLWCRSSLNLLQGIWSCCLPSFGKFMQKLGLSCGECRNIRKGCMMRVAKGKSSMWVLWSRIHQLSWGRAENCVPYLRGPIWWHMCYPLTISRWCKDKQLLDLRGSSDLGATLSYSLKDGNGHARTEDTGSVGLEATVNSRREILVTEDRAAEDQRGAGSADDQRYDMNDRIGDHPWMEEESWWLQHLFPDARLTTRHGRMVRTPLYLRD